MSELTALTAAQMRAGLLAGDFSAVELTEAHLSRIRNTNEKLNSILTICEGKAKLQAQHADEIIKKEKSASPKLTGIPIAVKDMIVTEGVETTCASKILKGFIPPYDSTVVDKLKANAAVIVGKANLDEFAMGSSNENSAFGVVRNPYDLERVPGGSSGGSAVSVSGGQAALSLGTDTGGSIRLPASFTGVYGLKPTYGRVSRYGAVAFASSLDQIGPFARTPEDLAWILSAIAGVDEKDSTSMDVEVPDYPAELEGKADEIFNGLKVGVPKEYFVSGMDPEVEKATHEAIDKLQKLGAEIIDISLPHTEYAIATYYIIAPAEASSNLARYDGVRYGNRTENYKSLAELYANTRAEGFGAEVKRRILVGTYVLSAGYYDAYYLKAQQIRTLIINDFKAAFANHCSMIAIPVAPTTAFKIGEKAASPLEMYLQDVCTVPISLAGLPGLSMPTCLDSKGLPIGLQLVGPAFSEGALLSVADRFSKEYPFDTAQCTTKVFD